MHRWLARACPEPRGCQTPLLRRELPFLATGLLLHSPRLRLHEVSGSQTLVMAIARVLTGSTRGG